MKPKRTKLTSPPPVFAEISVADRDLLTNAYKTGLIANWRRDSELNCRLTLGNGRDEYVEITKLSGYLEKLRKNTS